MPGVVDFRTLALDAEKVNVSGRNVGRTVFWKLYAIENLVRVVAHSVLEDQLGSGWWALVADRDTQKRVSRSMADHASKPWHGSPGLHEIYYTTLGELSRIMTSTSHLFEPVISDIDQWIARIEQIRLPRNVVGHMNWPSVNDRRRVDLFFSDFHLLVNRLVGAGTMLRIP